MHSVADFSLSIAKLECPACSRNFEANVVGAVSAVTIETPFETDLHRVYSSSALRGSKIGMCTSCGYASWARTFKSALLNETANPPLETTELQLRKFARAYVCGKQHKLNHLELGLVALSASWCARDGKTADLLWQLTAREELERGLRHPSSRKDRGFFHYLLGELYRHEADFQGALKHFDLACAGGRLSESLLLRQKVQACSGDSAQTLLPPYLVENLFCPVKSYRAA
jgi:hypothetical protein